MNNLLTRDKFREGVFKRDDNKCVICSKPAKDAHHIIERRLFSDGGYYLDNGASLCEEHHIEAEKTTLSCDTIREKANIKHIILPDHFYKEYSYDKWGNIILPNQTRVKGELFYDESVQKILKEGNVLNSFQKYIKYQRTYHLDWSNLLKDDRILKDDSNFKDKKVVVTLKMDGECTNFYNDYVHARSLEYTPHETRKKVKGIWSNISYLIDENMRICGENLYAKHTIHYEDLPSYFMIFSIWIDNICLSWKETKEYAEIFNLPTVPVIYEGLYDKETIINSFEQYKDKHEGYVIRLADEFTYMDFKKSIAKFVQLSFKEMVNNAHGHWISKKIEVNKLK
jgi:hypothetical protein